MNYSTTCSASEMTYIVSSGALNSTHSLNHLRDDIVDAIESHLQQNG